MFVFWNWTYDNYDGEDIIQELDQNNQVIATYTHGPGIDEPLCLEKNSQKYYYISDGLGSVTALVDSSGNTVQTYRYNSFGNIIDSTGTINQPYTYTGREFDKETGLFYYRHRYYDPKIGRFLQEDPIGFAGGINKYVYVYNNPLNLVDPYGLIWVTTGYKMHPIRNAPKKLLMWWTIRAGEGLDNPYFPGSNPDEWVSMKRDIVQEWQCDPNNPKLDKLYPIGTKREISQTYTINFAGSPHNEIANVNDDNFYYQWDPWVNSPTYKEFANERIIFPK